MGSNVNIPAVVKSHRIMTIFSPVDDLRYLIDEYLGQEVREIYNEIIQDSLSQGDDTEKLKQKRDVLNTVELGLEKVLEKKYVKKDDIKVLLDFVKEHSNE